MDSDDSSGGFGFGAPALVSLTPFASAVTPTLRRLSSCFTRPNEPAVKATPQLSWLSLQGRLVGTEVATAAKTIDPYGVLGAEEAAAWELFSPIQRVLVVAVVAVATANSKQNKRIYQLQKSVQLRDEVLLGMQQKLDALCDQWTCSKDQPAAVLTLTEAFVEKGFDSGCKLCQHHMPPQNGALLNSPTTKGSNGDEYFKYKMPISIDAEAEERRMSDLSDWAPSVASSVDVQLDGLSIDHEMDTLRKECEEKDVTIAEMSAYIQSSEALGSKRIVELEDLIRRKNMIINKLRKDILVLEQKVMCLTRLRRQSFPAAASSDTQQRRLPMLMDNLLYDMDSTTSGPSSSSSSSDSDNSPNTRRQALSSKMQNGGDLNSSLSTSTYQKNNSRPETTFPRKVNLTNQAADSVPPGSRIRRTTTMSNNGENRTRRLHPPHPAKTKGTVVHKRWA